MRYSDIQYLFSPVLHQQHFTASTTALSGDQTLQVLLEYAFDLRRSEQTLDVMKSNSCSALCLVPRRDTNQI